MLSSFSLPLSKNILLKILRSSVITLLLCLCTLPVRADTGAVLLPDYCYTAYQFFLDSGYKSDGENTSSIKVVSVNLTHNQDVSITDDVMNTGYTLSEDGRVVKPLLGTSYDFVKGVLSGSIKGNATISEGNVVRYTMPWMVGSFEKHVNTWIEKDVHYYLSFISAIDYSSLIDSQFSIDGLSIHKDMSKSDFTNRYVTYVIEFWSDSASQFSKINLPAGMNYVIPLYLGRCDHASDAAMSAMGLRSFSQQQLLKIATSVSTGDSVTSSAASASFDTSKSLADLNTSSSSFERGFSDDFSQRNGAFSVQTDKAKGLLSLQKFTNSSKFVSNVFQKMVVNTPFEIVLTFSLVLGISLIMIGRIRSGR